jgi:hypothetical protein
VVLDAFQPSRITYRVGGLPVGVCSPSHPLLPETNPEYLPFLSTEHASARDGILVDLRIGEIPAEPAGRVLLEAGDSWVLRERGLSLAIAPHPGHRGDPLAWEAEIDRGSRSVRILCAPSSLVERDGVRRLSSPFHYPLDQVVLMIALAGEGAIVHAAGVDLRGKGVILAGQSRAGKTTLSRLCASGGIPVLSDDRVIIRRVGDELRIFGTPWPGEGRFAENRSVPLAALVFLTKGDENRLKAIPRANAVRRLLPVLSLPWFDRELADLSLDFCTELTARVPAHELIFRPDAGAVCALEAVSR